MPYGRSVFTWVAIATTSILTGSLFGSVALGVRCAVIGNVAPGWHLKVSARLALLTVLIVALAVMVKDGRPYFFDAPFFAVALVLLCAIPFRRTGLTKWLGGVSYPLYLNAWIGVFAFNAISKRFPIFHGWSYDLCLAICAVAGAAVSYRLIDRVVMAHRSRYFSKRIGWLLGASAYLLVTLGLVYGLHEAAERS
jgi:peptidoglycan/LPS O-acetylase OafA/YrhL